MPLYSTTYMSCNFCISTCVYNWLNQEVKRRNHAKTLPLQRNKLASFLLCSPSYALTWSRLYANSDSYELSINRDGGAAAYAMFDDVGRRTSPVQRRTWSVVPVRPCDQLHCNRMQSRRHHHCACSQPTLVLNHNKRSHGSASSIPTI